MHIQDFVGIYMVGIAGFDVEVRGFFVILTNDDRNMNHQLIFAVVAAKMEESFVLKSGDDLQVFVHKALLANVAGNGLFELFDDLFEFWIVHRDAINKYILGSGARFATISFRAHCVRGVRDTFNIPPILFLVKLSLGASACRFCRVPKSLQKRPGRTVRW